jgi:hypothetical protein
LISLASGTNKQVIINPLAVQEVAMKLNLGSALVIVTSFLTFSSTGALAETVHATLTGIEEVPVVSTVATGEFRATINRGDQSIDFELRYRGLQGTVQQGHLHVAQPAVNGSIVVWLCQTAPSFLDPAGLAEPCQPGQATEAVIKGTIMTANVIAGSMTGQQLTVGDLAEVIRAMRAGAVYVNVHTTLSPGGEIRGQIRASKGKGNLMSK